MHGCALQNLGARPPPGRYVFGMAVTDADAIRVIVEHRREAPVALFSLDGRPHLRLVDVGRTDVSAYQALLTEAAP